jgi:hypothetical protein
MSLLGIRQRKHAHQARQEVLILDDIAYVLLNGLIQPFKQAIHLVTSAAHADLRSILGSWG